MSVRGLGISMPAGKGVRIMRDNFNVPHIYGKTNDDVTWGAGWALAHDRERAQLARHDEGERVRNGGKHQLQLSAEQIVGRRPLPPVWHVNDLHAGFALEQLAGQMRRRADPG